jgi:hypothetical protein
VPYIIDQANLLKNNEVQRCSLVIDGNRIDYISEQTNQYQWIRMPVSEFLLTAGHVMLDFSFQKPRTFSEFKQYVQKHLIARGCTTLLAVCDVLYEKQLPKALHQLRQHLLNIPIDYFIGVKIPLRTLTPSFVRACKRLKIPVIFIELQGEEPLHEVPWSWIYESLYSYPLTLVPHWMNNVRQKKLEASWCKLLSAHRIPFIPFSLQERTPLSLDVLKKIGIYPQKGDLRIGGEVDYNLYERQALSCSVAEKAIVDYDNHVPVITVHKGRLIKVQDRFFFYPGFGKERTICAPGMFAAYFK